jgi:aerobic-type carbon monoxide dehydrogenase small subunit (CoxS/CutS family)
MPERVVLTVNGVRHELEVAPRTTLADLLREQLDLTGTHLGCEHGVCGACTVHVDGRSARSCILLAVQADGAEVTTVEGLARGGALTPVQQGFWERHGMQCGFCTPGFLMTVTELMRETPDPTDDEIRDALGGNVCRCTGYTKIIEAVHAAARLARTAEAARPAEGMAAEAAAPASAGDGREGWTPGPGGEQPTAGEEAR